MIAVYAKNIVSEENREEFLNIAKELVAETRKEPGNISYQLIQDREKKDTYVFLEQWPDQEALDIHMATEHFKRLVGAMSKVVTGEGKVTIHEIIM